MEDALKCFAACQVGQLAIVQALVVTRSLNQHVKGPQATEGAHQNQNHGVPEADLLGDVGKDKHARTDGRTSHTDDTTSEGA
mgnify:CR=1 FL=1